MNGNTMSTESAGGLELSRQALMVPSEVSSLKMTLIGIGAIGSNVATILARTGVKNFVLVDPDTVGIENLGPTSFSWDDVGELKVNAMSEQICEITGDTANVEVWPERYRGRIIDSDIVIVGVDSMHVRQQLWDWRDQFPGWKLWLDGRIGHDQMSVYTVLEGDGVQYEYYEQTLQRAQTELPCGQKATAYICSLIAGIMSGMVVSYLNNGLLPREIFQKTGLEGGGMFFSVIE